MRAQDAPAGWGAIEAVIKSETALNAGRRKLVDAALRCFGENGYSATSVNDIANAAGMSIGSVYKYVRAKEDLLWLVSEAGFDRTNQALSRALAGATDVITKLCDVIDGMIRQVDRDRDLARLLYVEFQYMPRTSQQRVREEEERQVAAIEAVLEEGVADGEFDCEDTRNVAIMIGMFTSTWILKHHLFRGVSLDEFIRRQQAAALRLVGAPHAAVGS